MGFTKRAEIFGKLGPKVLVRIMVGEFSQPVKLLQQLVQNILADDHMAGGNESKSKSWLNGLLVWSGHLYRTFRFGENRLPDEELAKVNFQGWLIR